MGVLTDVIGGWFGGEQQSDREESARSASQEAANRAIALQERMYNQQRADQMPWLQQGGQAANLLGQFYGFTPSAVPSATPLTTTPQQPAQQPAQQQQYGSGLLGLIARGRERLGLEPPPQTAPTAAQPTPQPATQTPAQTPQQAQQAAMDRFFASPDYQFRLNEGNRNILANAAATGGLQSGATLQALNEYGQNLASGEFNNYWNRLAGLAGVGQNAAGNVGNAGSNMAAGSSNILMDNAAKRGTSYRNAGQIWGDVAGGMLGSLNSGANRLGGMMRGF